MDELAGFITPDNHVNFLAKKLFQHAGELMDGSIAYLGENGGGPVELHTHEHNHLFIVVKGEAKIFLDERTLILHENESYLVDGHIPHAIWNNQEDTTVMIGLSVK